MRIVWGKCASFEQRWEQGKEEEQMKRRIRFLTRMSTDVQLRPIWSQIHEESMRTPLTAGIQAVFPPHQLWTTAQFIQTHCSLLCLSLCLCCSTCDVFHILHRWSAAVITELQRVWSQAVRQVTLHTDPDDRERERAQH